MLPAFEWHFTCLVLSACEPRTWHAIRNTPINMKLLFWTFFPDEGFVLLIALGGLALMLGFRQVAASLIGSTVLFMVLSPFVEQFVAGFSPFWQLLILALVGLVLLRTVVVLLLGKQTAAHLAALLLHDLILLPFRALGWLLGRRRHA